MRGFLVLNGKPGSENFGRPLAAPPTVNDPALDNQIQLQARVYNYSVVATAKDIQVRFDLVQVDDTGRECTDPAQCLTRRVLGTVTAACVNPYNPDPNKDHPQNCDRLNSPTLPPRGIGLATLPLDISALGPTAGAKVEYRVYVIVDPDNQFPDQTHGWHQVAAVLTPGQATTAGDQYSIAIQDSTGKSIETVTYTSQGTLEDVLTGLAANLNKSPTATDNQLTANMITSGPTLIDGRPHIALTPKITNANAQLKPSTEFRAGFLVAPQGQALYFVPSVTGGGGAGGPTLTATNDVPAQNNEGYGRLTIFAAETLALIGDSPLDPCRPSNTDLSLNEHSMVRISQDGAVHTGTLLARPGEPLSIRLTAFADVHSPGYEYVEVFLGHPNGGGRPLARKMVHGIDAEQGGHAWFTWRAPQKPGLYTLYARLQERISDAQPGNNLAVFRVLVSPHQGKSSGGKR
jgi:hypothetical protein